ncbi:MAG: pyrroloquinoline quinone biosynthesis protein PqqB [Bacteroidetes bacterium]|nr:pyrroloquinoline quinone biosynthesis protein PqqB [Bacteroidota bacterium]
MVLGTAQDAGYPQAACVKSCCRKVAQNEGLKRYPACLAIVDEQADTYFLFEATPNIREQLDLLYQNSKVSPGKMPAGIVLTHAHIGHYAGLIQLGREVIGANAIPVHALPKMGAFLQTNGPWSQLVELENISIRELKPDSTTALRPEVSIRPFLVPHRDEFSETAGYEIAFGRKKALFIPDIDKWERWDRDIRAYLPEVDIAFLDATFFKDGELPNRNMAEIPHPFVAESMALLDGLSDADRAKVHFIHFNHTNPLLFDVEAQNEVLQKGYNLAGQGMKIPF